MIYIVYECDEYRNYSSYVIKYLCTVKRMATAVYNRTKKDYKDDECYYLNLSQYEGDGVQDCSGVNVFNEFELLLTTENN